MKTIFIFVPDTLRINQVGILEGFSKSSDNNISFYITRDTIQQSSLKCIGYCSETTPDSSLNKHRTSAAWIHINSRTNEVTVKGLVDCNDCEDEIITIMYDYKSFKQSDVSSFKYQAYGEHFMTLAEVIQSYNGSHRNGHTNILYLLLLLMLNFLLVIIDTFQKVYRRFAKTLCYSATMVHLNTNASVLKWAILKIKRDHKITLNVGNTLVSRFIDIIFGLTLLYFIFQYEKEFIRFVQHTTESVICGLEELLNFLMGSPVGLKLNYAFNNILGKFFLYHISLWRAFLETASPLLKFSFRLLVIPGTFGLSFQAALLSDLIAFSSFHVYCIYVYAARLYGVQIRGLASLWRLFIGRKYNPLRERDDSHQYTHHQLFIGTLGFTVLLFLLPTTSLYYAVFTVFRIGLVAVNGILMWLRYVLQCLPLYVTILWIINSSSIKGAVKVEVKNNFLVSSTIYATLETLSLWQSITNTMPHNLTNIPSIPWSIFFRSITTGLLL